MNHQTAKIIAASYRQQVLDIWNQNIEADESRLQVARVRAMEDHAEVWEGVARAIARDEYPLGTEARRVP